MFFNLLFKLPQQNQCLSWDYYYGSEQTPMLIHRITTNSIDQVEIEETNVYVYRCLFEDCSTESNGGVLSFTKDNGKLLIEYSIFEECHSENAGGVFYVYCESDCVINNICSYKCYALNYYGQFIYSYLQNDKKNYVISSSICSTYEIYGKYTTIHLEYGSQKCESVNISNYNVFWCSAIYYYRANTLSDITYCSIVSNNAVDYNCLSLSTLSSSIKCIIESCNIVNNSQQNYIQDGTISCDDDTEIKHSNIIDNYAQYLFYMRYSPTVTIDDTYIEHGTNSLKSGTGSLNTKGRTDETIENTFEFIDCDRLENRFRITSDVYCYFLFLNFIRASLLPSIYI